MCVLFSYTPVLHLPGPCQPSSKLAVDGSIESEALRPGEQLHGKIKQKFVWKKERS